MIVQVYDHKSTAPAQDSAQSNSSTAKTVPFSVHNHNPCLTPSPWAPYPVESGLPGKEKASSEGDLNETGKLNSGLKDKENIPVPAFIAKSAGQPKKPKVSTIVLHPTPISNHADIVIKASSSRSANIDGRSEPRQEGNAGGPLPAMMPPTPNSAIPPTPQTSMAPPAKKLKKAKMEIDINNIHAAESHIVLATTAPLALEPVKSVTEAAALLDYLAHPMHSEKPPSPKTRKRTVAEMAADEALAAEQERYMLILDERLSNTVGVQGAANPADGDGQAGGASFEPRFERFKTLENIRNQHEENKKNEKARQQEVERKTMQDRERERLRQEAEKRGELERLRNVQMAQQAAAVRQQQQQQEAHRRALAVAAQQQASQQTLQGVPQQLQAQHAHPQPNGMMPDGMQAQPQRFHQQQVSQAQISSPIVRNGTPQSHSSPTVNNIGSIPMQHSTPSMAGSPPRPGSVNPQMGGPTSHGMTAQRSQQSHAGTPRMPSATPNLQSTPLNRQMSQTPRMSQASPLQGPMVQAPHIQQMMVGGIPMNLNPAQQQQFQLQQQQQQMIQQRILRQREAAAQGLGGMNGPQMNQNAQLSQQQMMLLRAQQSQQGNMPQFAQNYAAQMAAMAQRTGGMPQNFNNPNMPNMAQMQQMQNHQAAAQAQQNQTQIIQRSISNAANALYQQYYPQLQAQYPGGIPEEAIRALKAQCTQQGTVQVQNTFRARRQIQQQQQMMAGQQGGMQQNPMNGMGMQRPQGM